MGLGFRSYGYEVCIVVSADPEMSSFLQFSLAMLIHHNYINLSLSHFVIK